MKWKKYFNWYLPPSCRLKGAMRQSKEAEIFFYKFLSLKKVRSLERDKLIKSSTEMQRNSIEERKLTLECP